MVVFRGNKRGRALVFGLLSRYQADVLEQALTLLIEELNQKALKPVKQLEEARNIRRRIWRLQERFNGQGEI
jgi:hypothetical protein